MNDYIVRQAIKHEYPDIGFVEKCENEMIIWPLEIFIEDGLWELAKHNRNKYNYRLFSLLFINWSDFFFELYTKEIFFALFSPTIV